MGGVRHKRSVHVVPRFPRCTDSTCLGVSDPFTTKITNGSHISQACLQSHARLTFSAALQRCGKPSWALPARSKTTPAEKTSLGLMCFRCWSTWCSRWPRTLARWQEAPFPFLFPGERITPTLTELRTCTWIATAGHSTSTACLMRDCSQIEQSLN